MRNFFRTVKIGLQYRLTTIGIIACSLLVALFWSANIGTIYPMVEVVFQGKSIPAYLDSEIITLEETIGEKFSVVNQWKLEGRSSADIQFVESQIRDATRSRDLKQSFIPFARKWLPNTPFDTLILVIVALLVGTLIKCSLLMANIILVERFSQRSMLTLRNDFYARTLNMSLGSFSNDRTGELMSRFTNDTEALTMGVKMLIGKTVREPLKMIACLGGAAFISWRLLLLCLIVTPIAGLMIGILSKALKRSNKTAMQSMA
ncbi:MAG: ABC transporter transmembrane domain-containing protein, partial [Pirellulales bacterium]